jgi:hypothetical protein
LLVVARSAKETSSWLGLVRIHDPWDVVYARPSNITLPWITGFKHDAVIHKSYLTWVDFNKLQANEYIQIVCKKIKGPVIILARLSLTKRTIILYLVPLGVGLVIYNVMTRILLKVKPLMSPEIYLWFEPAVELAAGITAGASAAFALFAMLVLLDHLPGIYIQQQGVIKIA